MIIFSSYKCTKEQEREEKSRLAIGIHVLRTTPTSTGGFGFTKILIHHFLYFDWLIIEIIYWKQDENRKIIISVHYQTGNTRGSF